MRLSLVLGTILILYFSLQLEAKLVNKRIISGHSFLRSELPFLVSILTRFPHHRSTEGSLCGGTLLTSRVVLTAAHCLHSDHHGTKATDVILTINDFSLGRPDLYEVKVYAKEFDLHPRYISSKFDPSFDIALIYLPYPVGVCSMVGLPGPNVALLPINTSTHEVKLSDEQIKKSFCYLVGWGLTASGSNAVTAQRMRLDKVRFYEDPQRGTKTFLSKGYAVSRACFGDSGSPIYCDFQGKHYLIGIASQIGTEDGEQPMANSNVEKCRQAPILESVDLRSQMGEISRMLKKRSDILHKDMIKTQRKCYKN